MAPWCDVSGPIDGAADRSAGVAILDHPANPCYPTPWYTGSGTGTFLDAALLFQGPGPLTADATLVPRYRILVRDVSDAVADVRCQFERYTVAS